MRDDQTERNLRDAYDDESGERLNELFRADRNRIFDSSPPRKSGFGEAIFWTVVFLVLMGFVVVKLVTMGAIIGPR